MTTIQKTITMDTITTEISEVNVISTEPQKNLK